MTSTQTGGRIEAALRDPAEIARAIQLVNARDREHAATRSPICLMVGTRDRRLAGVRVVEFGAGRIPVMQTQMNGGIA